MNKDIENETEEEVDASPNKEESPAKDSESEEGENTMTSGEGVKLSEEFQSEVHSLLSSATKPECEYIRSCIGDREMELHKAEKKSDKTAKASGEAMFSEDGMPGMA